MRTRRLAMILAVVAMVMGVMAPASAAKGGVNSADLMDKGWDCSVDNFAAGGAGVHCAKASILAFLGAEEAGTTLHVMVFSSPADSRYGSDEVFLGTEILRFAKDGSLPVIARHAWHGGFDPTT